MKLYIRTPHTGNEHKVCEESTDKLVAVFYTPQDASDYVQWKLEKSPKPKSMHTLAGVLERKGTIRSIKADFGKIKSTVNDFVEACKSFETCTAEKDQLRFAKRMGLCASEVSNTVDSVHVSYIRLIKSYGVSRYEKLPAGAKKVIDGLNSDLAVIVQPMVEKQGKYLKAKG